MNLKRIPYWSAVLFVLALAALAPRPGAAIPELEPDPILSSFYVETNKAAMDAVADKFEVHSRMGQGFEVIVPAHRAKELFELVPSARLLESDIGLEARNADTRGYHNFQTVESHLRDVVAKYPNIASLDTYGKSKEGRTLFALELTNRSVPANQTIPVMLTAATHGDELITVEVVMGFVDMLAQGYGKDARLTKILDKYRVYVLPVINPDGYVRKSRYANGVDPNRDYPWPQQPDRNPNECIQAVMDFAQSKEIKGSIDYHSSGGLFMYPWSYTESSVSSLDKNRFHSITQKMAKTNGYRYGQIPHLLYIAKGASADWYYWKLQTLAIAVEIGNSNVPSASTIPKYVKGLAESAWLFIEEVK